MSLAKLVAPPITPMSVTIPPLQYAACDALLSVRVLPTICPALLMRYASEIGFVCDSTGRSCPLPLDCQVAACEFPPASTVKPTICPRLLMPIARDSLAPPRWSSGVIVYCCANAIVDVANVTRSATKFVVQDFIPILPNQFQPQRSQRTQRNTRVTTLALSVSSVSSVAILLFLRLSPASRHEQARRAEQAQRRRLGDGCDRQVVDHAARGRVVVVQPAEQVELVERDPADAHRVERGPV